MTSSELIEEAKRVTEESKTFLENAIIPLSSKQKKWKLNSQSWSIFEILAHLNKFAVYYNQTFEKYLKTTKFNISTENFVSSPLGRSVWNSMKLGNAKNVKRKLKSLRQFNPIYNDEFTSGKDDDFFKENLIQLSEIIEKAKNINLKRVKIPISISKIIRLRFGDALLMVVYHNERHIQQCKNLIQNPNFPK